MGQQVGPEGLAAEDQGVPILLAQPRDGLVTVGTPDDRRLVAPRPGVVCGRVSETTVMGMPSAYRLAM
jgi:hypothetical protein